MLTSYVSFICYDSRMRLFLSLIPEQDVRFPIDHYALQGVLYGAFRELGLSSIHEKPGTKFFCFSNIYPYTPGAPFPKGKEVNWQISSPNSALIKRLAEYFGIKGSLSITSYLFRVKRHRVYSLVVPDDEIILQTATPICTRIPVRNCREYGIPVTGKTYVEWRVDNPLNPFIKQLYDNVIKKYKQYTGVQTDEEATGGQGIMFRGFRYVRHERIVYHGRVLYGTHWQFVIPLENGQMKHFISCAVEMGFGERNSAGFGFMNKGR